MKRSRIKQRKLYFLRNIKKRIAWLLIALSIVLVVSGCAVQKKASLANQTDYKYTMYVGLNDKDTYKQILSDDEAEKIMSEICLKYVDGYTFSKRQGAYKNEKGVVTKENSLVFEFYDTTDEKIKDIMNEALVKFNQSSILIEKTKVNYQFYEGADKK